MEAKELSYVIVPSDVYSHNVRIYSPKSNNLKESLDNEKEVLIVKDNTNLEKEVEVKESTSAEVEVIENANAEITSLKEELEKVKAENTNLKELKENAENEIIELTSQLKEMAIEQISYLREKLKRPALLKEHLEKRNQDSLMDTILDLKEELDIISNKTMDVKESLENNEEKNEIDTNTNFNTITNTNNNSDGISTVESLKEVKSDVLVDNDKDSLNKNEKNSNLDVKESLDNSNKDYEDNIEKIKNFYRL